MKKAVSYFTLVLIGFVIVSLAQFVFVIMPPQLTSPQTPEFFDLPRENVMFQTDDGILLTGWFVEPSPSVERALILLHSYPFDKTDLLPLAAELYPDFAFLLFDFRSFGDSSGRYTTFGVKEQHDVVAALNFLESRGYTRIGVFGSSLGGAVALIAAAEDPRINAVSSYAAYADITVLGNDTFDGLRFLAEPFVNLLSVWARPLFGAWPSDISPEHAAQNIIVPTLIVHARTDMFVPFAHAEKLQNALSHNPSAEFYFPETGTHGELPTDIAPRLYDFFGRTLHE
ncbi:MAG: hypothetical protein COW88_00615 [Candidatus Lloydbacteria bacterium CG22_combo_CG10-13_8_21_14_all_47_15]|uniref:Peptidase S9 prolyl oligopeptidase catalytic domain-containing protein n=1 Tax=Candidatus Lloydbacteria bacterium CG22_combo_CG10-13_8_21_14_all_47_15 TaxID=1974635 RepID=A0A2H0CV87_9BACT|nr:MAG: hypothetical protein COW88_00615 [Candidatus Lloydbacteria bacterium CG22_combo_CG10-13_8_21_14_all_47_15]